MTSSCLERHCRASGTCRSPRCGFGQHHSCQPLLLARLLVHLLLRQSEQEGEVEAEGEAGPEGPEGPGMRRILRGMPAHQHWQSSMGNVHIHNHTHTQPQTHTHTHTRRNHTHTQDATTHTHTTSTQTHTHTDTHRRALKVPQGHESPTEGPAHTTHTHSLGRVAIWGLQPCCKSCGLWRPHCLRLR